MAMHDMAGHLIRRLQQQSTQIFAQRNDLIGRGILTQHEQHRIAHVLKQKERDERHGDHDHDCLDEALNDKSKHSLP